LATTREEFFRLLKSIEAKLDRSVAVVQRPVQLNLGSLQSTLSSILTELQFQRTGVLATIEDLLVTIDIDTSFLPQIDADTSVLRTNSTAIRADVAGIESDVDLIVPDIDAIRVELLAQGLTLDELETEIKLQLNRSYAFVGEYEMSGVGGTAFTIKILNDTVGQHFWLDQITIQSNTLVNVDWVLEMIDTSSSTNIVDFDSVSSQGDTQKTFPNQGGDAVLQNRGFHFPPGAEIRWSVSSIVTALDEFFIHLTGKARTTDLPSTDHTASTITVTETIHEHTIG